MYVGEMDGLKKLVKKAKKIASAPIKDVVKKVTHPVASIKADVKRVSTAFKGGNPLDPFAAIAAVTSPGLRPLDAQLRKAGVKGGVTMPADMANKKLSKVLGTRGKGFLGNKPATIIGTLITGGMVAAGAGAGGAGAAGSGAGTGSAGGAAAGADRLVKLGRKGKDGADSVKKLMEDIAKATGDGSPNVTLTPGQGGAPPPSDMPTETAPVEKDKTLLYAGIGGGALLLLLLATNRRH